MISLCMIVRDEEDNLPRALDSVKDLVDDIVVVDTGSEDGTVAVAKRYGAQVFHHPWTGSFSEARNNSLRYARGDWILILDADETIPEDDHPRVRALLDNPDYDGYYFLNLQIKDEAGTVSAQHYNLRLFRNGLGVRYEGRVHNQPSLSEDRIRCTDVRLRHFGYMDGYHRKTSKYRRSAGLLEKELSVNPHAHHFRFHLGSLYLKLDRYDEGVRQIEMAAEKAENVKYRAKAYLMLGYLRLEENDGENAIPYLDRALETVPGYCEAQYLKAEAFRIQGRFEEALELFDALANALPGKLDAFFDMRDNEQIRTVLAPWKGALCRWLQGDGRTALDILTRLGDIAGKFRWKILLDTGNLLMDSGDYAGAEKHYRQTIEEENGHWETYLQLGLACLNQGRVEAGETALMEAYDLDREQPAVLMNLGGLRMQQGKWREALNCFDKVLGQFPGQVDALFNKALALERLEAIRDAEHCYRKLSREIPDNPVLFEKWADFCGRTGHSEKLPHLLGKAIKLDPGRHDLRLRRAEILVEQGRTRHNFRCLKEASAELAVILQAGAPEAAAAARLLEEIKSIAADIGSSKE